MSKIDYMKVLSIIYINLYLFYYITIHTVLKKKKKKEIVIQFILNHCVMIYKKINTNLLTYLIFVAVTVPLNYN